MRLASWNVNSIRARLDRVLALLDREGIDVLAMQETKCADDQFPTAAFRAAGYEVAHHGLHHFNGVAIASRVGLENVETSFPGQPAFAKPDQEPALEARALGATCEGTRVWSLYIPNGRALDDPHYAYKLAFLRALAGAAAAWIDTPVALVGDWNVAPFDTDIWSEEDPAAVTHVTPESRDALLDVARAGYAEVTRRYIPAEHTYTFWDYQQLRFPRAEGMRIDFAYASPPLLGRATGARILRDERKGKGASDHAPIIVDFPRVPGTV